MNLNNKNATFDQWFKELEQLAKKIGHSVYASETRWYDLFYDGRTPQEAMNYALKDLTDAD